MDNILILVMNYIDALWILLLMITLKRGQRLWAAGFVASCMLMMRLMIELMAEIGYPNGILGLIDMPLFIRGLWVYGVIYVLYVALNIAFPATKGIFLVASSLSMFFIAAMIFAGVMVL